MDHIAQLAAGLEQLHRERAERARERHESQLFSPHLLSGGPMFIAMKCAVDSLVSRAPQDHDVFIQMGDLSVIEARFIEPHTFLFEGFDQDGRRAGMVCHFSQVRAHVIYRPKRDTERIVSKVIQNFSPHQPSV